MVQFPWPKVMEDTTTALYDMYKDPHQEAPLRNRELEQSMIAAMARLLEANDAPPEVFRRLDMR